MPIQCISVTEVDLKRGWPFCKDPWGWSHNASETKLEINCINGLALTTMTMQHLCPCCQQWQPVSKQDLKDFGTRLKADQKKRKQMDDRNARDRQKRSRVREQQLDDDLANAGGNG